MKKLFLIMLLLPFSIKALELAPKAKGVIVLEESTGNIIYERNSHERRHPASMTKIMTMLLTMEAIENGNIKWDDIVTVSSNASSMGGSQILLETNEKISVYDLFKGVAVASGNDAAVALAETIAGTHEEFVNMMNNKVKQLNLKDTNFKNCHGLDDVNHYSSAYDMAIIGKELLKYDKVFEFTTIYDDYLRKGTDKSFWLVNTNKLIKIYNGADGLKTGYTSEAGFCITATAKRNNMRIITVVMGEPTSQDRTNEVISTFDYAFSQYELNNIIDKNKILTYKEVFNGKLNKVGIIPIDNLNILNKKGKEKKSYNYDIKIDDIKAPTKKGDIIGKLILKENDNIIRELNLTVFEDVKKANIFELYLRYLNKLLN